MAQSVKNPPAMQETVCKAGDPDSIPVPGRFPGGENGNLLLYSCLENPMERGAWQTTVQGSQKIDYYHRQHHNSIWKLMLMLLFSHQVVSDSATPWTASHQSFLSLTISWSLPKFMSIESVMPMILQYPIFGSF